MHLRPLLFWSVAALVAVSGFSGCSSLKKKKQEKKPGDMADVSADTSFQAFQGRLRKAVAKRDTQMLGSMMTANFGYSWEPGGEGPGVFDYWDRNNLWPELELVLREKFVPSGNFMVAPPQATYDTNYKGYLAGLHQVNGSWRFAYFVPAPPASETGR
ncbi:MAG: hypothetical protein PHQ12_01950 [Chthoniobacteraceae bacterium]|nr:hypothetical protein [Chthoniobacteraceae bacterium]